MRPVRTSLFSASLLVTVLLSCPVCTDAGGDAPICNVSCRPNPSSPTYGPTLTARSLPQNARGSADAVSRPVAGSPGSGGSKTKSAGGHGVIAGSQSYSYVIPILNLPGRNGLNVNLNLYYNSAVWTIDLVSKAATFNASQDFPSNGFRLNYGILESAGSGYLLTEPDGTVRNMVFLAANDDYQSTDSSFIDFNPSNLVLRRPDGSQWVYQQVGTTTVYVPIKIEDTNGNYLTVAYSTATNVGNQAISTITDTLARVITFNYNTSGELSSITAPAFGGGTYTAANFQWGTADLTYDFSLTVNDSPASGTNINVLTGCTYPNGTGYTFSYGAWGIVHEIKQNSSTGMLQSYVSYNYPSGTTKLSGAPTFTQQTIFDGVNTGTWTYANTISNGLVTSMAITDPSATITTTNLLTSGLPSSVTTGTSSKLLEQINYTWTTGGLPATITTTLKDTGQSSRQQFGYTAYGSVNLIIVSDWGTSWDNGSGNFGGAAGFAQLGQVTNTYQNTAAYINQHIYNRPLETQVFNGVGTMVSQTVYAYDASALTSEIGATNHDDTNYGTGFTTRGNLTSTTTYPTTSTPISHAYTYDTLGNLLTAQVSCCNQESWTFAADNEYAYPEILKRGVSPQFTSDRSYDFSTRSGENANR